MAGVLLPGPATVRSIRLLVATQVFGYITLALLLLAVLAGSPRAWLAVAAAITGALISLAMALDARRKASGPEVGPDYDAEGWRPPWADLYERPTHVTARAVAYLFAVFTLMSVAGALWIDARTWSVPIAYAATGLVALAVVVGTRRRPTQAG